MLTGYKFLEEIVDPDSQTTQVGDIVLSLKSVGGHRRVELIIGWVFDPATAPAELRTYIVMVLREHADEIEHGHSSSTPAE